MHRPMRARLESRTMVHSNYPSSLVYPPSTSMSTVRWFSRPSPQSIQMNRILDIWTIHRHLRRRQDQSRDPLFQASRLTTQWGIPLFDDTADEPESSSSFASRIGRFPLVWLYEHDSRIVLAFSFHFYRGPSASKAFKVDWPMVCISSYTCLQIPESTCERYHPAT